MSATVIADHRRYLDRCVGGIERILCQEIFAADGAVECEIWRAEVVLLISVVVGDCYRR